MRAQVSVELYIPHTGEHVKDTFWPCTFNLSKVILVSMALGLGVRKNFMKCLAAAGPISTALLTLSNCG